MPDAVAVNGWVALLTPLAVATLTVVNLIIAKVQAKHVATAAVAVAEVKDKLVETGEKTAAKLEDIHKLVNSEYAIALRVGAAALERIANSTKDAGDIESARVARNLSKDHDAKQNALDRSKEP